jgi:hypothetical protein
MILLLSTGALRSAQVSYLSDCPERILASSQSWGALGWDVAAPPGDRAGEPLRIGERAYVKRLGSHANGSIQVLLDGEYETFQAEVGLQPCSGGSVVFRVRVDGEVRFDSGILRTGEAAKAVEVQVLGAHELVLEAQDAGDGIPCDMANWAEARLVSAAVPAGTTAQPAGPPVDIAPLGRIVAWDANRMEGTRASRIEEFPAEDLFLETDLAPDSARQFATPATNGLACIGVQWLNRRAVKELSLTFLDPALVPPTSQVRVEGWFGESAWQGKWQPLAGELRRDEARLIFHASARPPAGGFLVTRKIRWVWPTTAGRVPVRRPVVFTRSRWATARLLMELAPPALLPDRPQDVPKGSGEPFIEVFNGALEPPGIAPIESRPGSLAVRYSRPSSFKSDPTHLRLALPQGRVTVAVQDILEHEAVYFPESGVFLCSADKPITLAAYRARIAGRKTVLEEVRQLPDQTLAQAMAKTHHAVQREGPVMLSLACDNNKYVVERDGTVRFRTTPHTGTDWFAGAGELRFDLGAAQPGEISPHLDGGWLPIPVITRKRGDVSFTQRSYVAPCDEPGSDPARLNRRPVCVVEFAFAGPPPPPINPGSPALVGRPSARQSRLRNRTGSVGIPCAAG